MSHASDTPGAGAPIRYEQVAAAAENLEHRGAEPTLHRVLELLGGGSPHLVQRHLGAWRDARPAPEPALRRRAPDRLWMNRVWTPPC